MTDIKQLSQMSHKFGMEVHGIMEQLTWLCIYSDDLKLAGEACVHYSDYRRGAERAPDATNKKIPTLDTVICERLGVTFARRTHVFSNRVFDISKMVASNRRRASLYFRNRLEKTKQESEQRFR